jgi:hypothetical protein
VTEVKPLIISHIERPYANQYKDSATGKTVVAVPVAAVPDGMHLQSLQGFFEEWRHKPERRKGTIRLHEDSFVDYVKRYRNVETSVMFVRHFLWWWRITVVFNYARASPEETETGFGDFLAITWTRDYTKMAQELNMTAWRGKP